MNSGKDTLVFLMASLKESQDTVRAYDTKAQIVGVGYIFAIGIIFEVGNRLGNSPEMSFVVVALIWLIFIFPITLFGLVLYPTRKTSPRLGAGASDVHRTFYADLDYIDDVNSYLEIVEASDPKKEIAYEIVKTAGLREIKRRRFLRALWAAAISFVLIFLSQLLRAEDLF
ncbi:MAG: hypothetical protein R3245_00540 [Kiloniellales bacterium]|nr:hypothetical protein [Kiloniellales bacterium]